VSERGRQVDLPHAAERAGDDAAGPRPLRVVLELFLVQSRPVCLEYALFEYLDW